jgi:hypothetical protein
VRKAEKDVKSVYSSIPTGGGGLGKFKPPRATLASKQEEIKRAYGGAALHVDSPSPKAAHI